MLTISHESYDIQIFDVAIPICCQSAASQQRIKIHTWVCLRMGYPKSLWLIIPQYYAYVHSRLTSMIVSIQLALFCVLFLIF